MVRDAAHAYAQDKLLPRVLEAFRHETSRSRRCSREMGALGLLGPTIPAEYGGAGLNYVCYGLIAREVERVDSGYRSMMSVQSSLVMFPIHTYGSEAQRRKYLPKLATGEWIGCFGLTEPNHGSDPGLDDHARAAAPTAASGSSGSKMWISNSPIADVFVVWAKNDDGVDPRLHPREGDEGPVRAEDRGQVQPARVDHRRDRDGRRVRAGGEPAAERQGPEGAVRLPQQRALRHRVGRARRGGVLLARGAAVHARPQAVRPPARREPAHPEEARRHADRDHARAAGLPAPRAA